MGVSQSLGKLAIWEAAATLCGYAVRFGCWVFPPGEIITAQLAWIGSDDGVLTSDENLTAEMRGSVRKMGVSPGETDNMD